MGEIPQIQKIRHLGSGAFGFVWEAEVTWPSHAHPNGIYAVKELVVQKDTDGKQSQLPKLIVLSCENIIRYFGHYHVSDSSDFIPKIQIITEHCPGGNLKEYLKRHGLCYSLMVLYFKQLRGALNYLHMRNIIHTDVKCANILLTDLDITGLYRSVKLGDVDDPIFKRNWKTITEDIPTLRGTIPYISPEMARKLLDESAKVGSATDWWSLGCVLYEMAFGYDAFIFEHVTHEIRMTTEQRSPLQTLKLIEDGGRLVLRECCRHLKEAFRICFAENPNERKNGMASTELFGDTHDFFRVPAPLLNGCSLNKAAVVPKMFEYYENAMPLTAQGSLPSSYNEISIWGSFIEIYVQPKNEKPAALISPNAPQNFIDALEQLKCAHVSSQMEVHIRLDYLRTVQMVMPALKHFTRLSDVVTHLRFYNKNSPSFEYLLSQLDHLFLPNLVHLAFIEGENVVLEADTFRRFPMLKILSFIDCSFTSLADNFLTGIKRLERFLLKRRIPPSASELTTFYRICPGKSGLSKMSWEPWAEKVKERYSWLLDFLSKNGDLISPKPVYTHVQNGIYQTAKWPEDWDMKGHGLDMVTVALAYGLQNWS